MIPTAESLSKLCDMKNCILLFCTFVAFSVAAQITSITISPAQVLGSVNSDYSNGVFFVPKTAPAFNDFIANAARQTAIRTNVIESALNNASNLPQCITLIQGVQTDLQTLSAKTDRLIFIFEKMPAWLSSSSNSSPAQTPGWAVLHTKPPANWNLWAAAVDSITDVLVNDFNITNAYFEIWNEPDLGSWTGTQQEYWMLYRTTFDAIKSAAPSAKVGGPAVNRWANNIYWQPPYGYVDNISGRQSLIGQLLDSSVVWNRIPDFISWHNFSMNYHDDDNAAAFIQSECASLSISAPELIISEWNSPSAVRDSPLATSYAGVVPWNLRSSIVSCNVFAAWQDFSQSTNEFHNDYGLLTYGAIHKPVHYTRLLHEKLNGSYCVASYSEDCHFVSTVQTDTVNLFISNYMPPPVFEALNYAMWNGLSNVNVLDSLGYIDLQNNDISSIDSVFNGLITISPVNTAEAGIVAAIPVYQHYLMYYDTTRTFQYQISGIPPQTNLTAEVYRIDSTHNNMQFIYDSLMNSGYTQSNAVNFILSVQQLECDTIQLTGGTGAISLKPNDVCLIRINVPGVSGIPESTFSTIHCYPNPVIDFLYVNPENTRVNDAYQIVDSQGRVVQSGIIGDKRTVDCRELAAGVYFLRLNSSEMPAARFVRN